MRDTNYHDRIVKASLVHLATDPCPVIASLDRALRQRNDVSGSTVVVVVVEDHRGRTLSLVVDRDWIDHVRTEGGWDLPTASNFGLPPVPPSALLASFRGKPEFWTADQVERAAWTDRGDGVLTLGVWR